ncbi:MAG: 16S rRNA (cytidine(1402)-2'-O)-methyltransferase [Candidatus Margulisiibacteriota bacterium]
MAGILYVVATPIGNLEDITFRAVRVLSEVDLIAAEDTRQTKILLNKYNITTRLTSYHKFNIKTKTGEIIEAVLSGRNVALVSDAGMPGISDPGYELVRGAVEAGIRVEPIPGASAAITALAVSGLPTDRFIFHGFLPKKPGKKRKALERLKATGVTVIMYESPFRLVKTLTDIRTVFGDRPLAVCRELTKKFEEIKRGKTSEVLAHFQAKVVKGEIVIVVEGLPDDAEREVRSRK